MYDDIEEDAVVDMIETIASGDISGALHVMRRGTENLAVREAIDCAMVKLHCVVPK